MSKKIDARRALEILRDDSVELRAAAEKLGCTVPATDEARALCAEIDDAEVDAILALPPALGRALLWAAASASRHDVLSAACAEGEKDVQREARRVAHALKQKGIELELPSRAPEARPAASAEPATEEPPVWLSSLDARGERAIFWTRLLPGRGIELAQLVVSDERGVIDLALGELSRKRFREVTDELPRRGVVTIREVSRDDARKVLDRARVRAREGGKQPPTFAAWAAQVLGPAPAEAPPPLAPRGEGRPPDDAAALQALVARSATLLDEPELQRWTPGEEAMRTCAQVAAPALTAPEGEARDKALSDVCDDCAALYFDEAQRALWAARLLDTALLFEETERPEAAQIAAATARYLAADVPSRQIPLARAIFVRALARL